MQQLKSSLKIHSINYSAEINNAGGVGVGGKDVAEFLQ